MSSSDYPLHTRMSDDIIAQAKAGSIAAIIQLLNESLAHLRVRTRAVLENRSLLLLCEAESEDLLAAEIIIPHVRQILETIAPANIRRIRFFSRLTREQQLLWTQEIAHSDQTQVLWSEEIILKRPSLVSRFQGIVQGKSRAVAPSIQDMPRRLTAPSHARPLWPTFTLLGVGVVALIVGGAIGVKYLWHSTSQASAPQASSPPTVIPTAQPTVQSSTKPTEDTFVQAVRLAEQAAADGKKAKTRSEWLDLAYRWQQASELMNKVPAEDNRYHTAQDRVVAYRKNSEAALAQADQY